MPPLTSPSCHKCDHLAEKLTLLENQIATLLRIHEADKLSDTVLVGPVKRGGAERPPSSRPKREAAEASPSSNSSDGDHWRPQVMSSTPSKEQWCAVGSRGQKRRLDNITHQNVHLEKRKRGSDAAHHEIHLENKFDILSSEDFPPLEAGARLSIDMCSLTSEDPSRRRASIAHFTPAPGYSSTSHLNGERSHFPLPIPPSPPPLPAVRPKKRHLHAPLPASEQLPKFSPRRVNTSTTLIIGDSIVRNVRRKSAVTLSFSGAKVRDILDKLPVQMAKHPSAHNIVIHVGCNDISDHTSEILKRDFSCLLGSPQLQDKHVVISGPIAPNRRGAELFSRTLYFHTWLKSLCETRNVQFVDNFNLFWKRPSLFRADGIHLNPAGSRTLSDHISHCLAYGAARG